MEKPWFEDHLSESKKAHKKRQKKNRKEKARARLQKFQIEEEANEITTSGPIAEEVEIRKLEHDPSSNSTCASISEEDLEELMISIKKDPYLKPILEDIEIGGPIVMMRGFQKLAQAMGFGVLGDNVSPVEDSAASNADAEDYTAK